MPTLNLSEEQVLSMIDQLFSDQQTQILQKLFQKQQTNADPLRSAGKTRSQSGTTRSPL
jgi:hypothetical protein